jgi:hypothetical protein
MAVTNERSAFIRDFKKREKELAEVAKESVGGGFMTDEELIETLELGDTKKQFVTKVSRVRYGNDKNKNPYFAFNFTIAQGEHEGLTVSQFIGLGGKTKADRQKGMKRLCGLFQRLDYDTTSWATDEIAVNAVEAADTMTQNKPGVRLSLGTWGDANDRLNIDVVGLVNSSDAPKSTPPAKKEAKSAPSQESKVSMESLGAKADEGDEDAVNTLTEAATAANVDPDEFETWMDLGVHLDKGSSSDSEEDYSEYVGYEAVFDSEETGELSVTASAYDKDSGLFTVTDEDDNEYECEFSDLTFEEE